MADQVVKEGTLAINDLIHWTMTGNVPKEVALADGHRRELSQWWINEDGKTVKYKLIDRKVFDG